MARRARTAAVAPVVWRDGVHLSDTPIWCDARRRRDVCFVSSAERIGRAGHGQLIGTASTLALLGVQAVNGHGHLAVPLRQRFTLGTLRLELLPSGRGLGAAALHVDLAGRSVLYAGAIRSDTGGFGEPAGVRACDAVVVAAPFGDERHAFPPLAGVIAQTIEWTRAQLAADRRPVLLVDTALDGLEVATRLAGDGLAIAASHAIRTAAARLDGRGLSPTSSAAEGRRGSIDTAELPTLTAPGREPRAIVWLAADRAALARTLGDRAHATALVSGRALDGAAPPCDAAFAWTSAAGRAPLLAWIDATSARTIFVTGACAESIAAALGPRARVLGPPHQMTLFDEATRAP